MKTTIQDIFREVLPEGHSFSEARRQVYTAGVHFNGEQVTSLSQEVDVDENSVFQVGKKNIFHREGGRWTRLATLQNGVKYLTQLQDSNDAKEPPICLKIQRADGDNLLMLGAEGYGEKSAEDGYGFPVVIEYHERAFRLLIWGDINNEEPTQVISLEGAREDARKEDGAGLEGFISSPIHP